MNTEQSKLHEVVSTLAKKLEEEKRLWEETTSVKDSEIAAFKKELESKTEQLRTNEEQTAKLKEKVEYLEAQNNALKNEVSEMKNTHKNELESREKEWKNEMEKAKQLLLDTEVKSIEQMLSEERLKWREKIRTNG